MILQNCVFRSLRTTTVFKVSRHISALVVNPCLTIHTKSVKKNIPICYPTQRRLELLDIKLFSTPGPLTHLQFEQICEETLDSLVEYLEELIETVQEFNKADITYSDGVITAFLGDEFGTYVINRQTPNQQIWLSSPLSGPKRYDFIKGAWVYKHDNSTLHTLLDSEIGNILKRKLDFSTRCAFGKEDNC